MAPRERTAAALSGWDRFWFSPASSWPLERVRVGLALVAALYFASHWADIAWWFGRDGVLSNTHLAWILASAEGADSIRWRLSPLYWFDSPLLLRGFLALALAACLALWAGVGGRLAALAVWLAVVALANRSWVITGLVEVPLAFGLIYLLITPIGRGGWHGGWLRGTASGHEEPSEVLRWTAGVARRLLQVHTTAFVGLIVAVQLAARVWWNGEAVAHLVMPLDDRPWDLSTLADQPLLASLLTHLLVLLPIPLLVMLWIGRTRRLAAWGLIAWALVLGGLSAQLLYATAIAVLLCVFLDEEPSPAEDGDLRAAAGAREAQTAVP